MPSSLVCRRRWGHDSPPPRIPPNYPDNLPYMPCPVPRRTEQVLVGFFPIPAAFPGYKAVRHTQRHFRALLRLHSRYGLQGRSPPNGELLSRGFDLTSCPAKPLGSYHVSPTT